MALTASQLDTIYQNVLFRPAEPAAIAFYANRTDVSDAQIRQQIELSPEAVVFTNPVVRLFETAFNRLPTQADLRFYGLELKSGFTTEQVAAQLTASTEFSARLTGGVVTADFVQTVYQDLLGRSASASEVSYYLARSAAQLVNGVANSPEATLANAAAVITFVDSAAQGSPNTGDLDVQSGVLANTNFTLQTTADNLIGTGGPDTFFGVAGTGATFSAADVINGAAGNDTLQITTDAGFAINGTSVTNVETLRVSNVAAGAATVTLNNAGFTTFENNGSIGALTFAGATSVGSLNVSNTTAATTVAYTETAVNGTTDVVNVGLNNVTGAAAININSATGNGVGVETIALTSSGTTSNSVSLTTNDTSLTKITVAGSAALTLALGTNTTTVATIDASTDTGGVTVTGLGVAAQAVTGGSGSDKFVFGANFGSTDTVVGGSGTDTLSIDGLNFTDAANSSQLTGLNTKVSGVEVLELTGTTATTIQGGTGTGAFTNTEITKILFNTDAADTVNQAGSSRTYAFGELNTGNATLNLSAGTTTVNVSLEAIADTVPAGNTGADVGTLAVNLDAGAVAGTTSTLNLVSTGPGTVSNIVSAITAVSGSTINISGSHDLTVSGLTNGGTVNASSFTGKLTLTGSTVNDSITAGTGNDTITGGGGVDVINLSAGGTDTVVSTGTFAAGATDYSNITGFTFGTATGSDRFDVNFAVTNGTTNVAAGTGTTNTIAALTPVAVASNGTATANDVIFTFSGAGDKLAAGTTGATAVANAVTALTSGTDFASANVAAGDSLVLVLDDGTNSFVYHYVADATPATTTAADLQLVGIVNGQLASQVAVGNFI